MEESPKVPGRHNVLGRLRDFWDDGAPESRSAAEPRRALIPEYELYEPPPSRWKKLRSEFEDVQFVAFIVMLCLAVLFVLTVLIAEIANSTGLDVAWLAIIAIVLGVGALISFAVAFSDKVFTGDGYGGG
jgi:hypothetical protein